MPRLAICAVLASALSACSASTPVTLHNGSAYRLESMVFSGSGFEASLGTVAPGQSVTTRVYPSGESGLAVRFEANDRIYSYKPQGYFEGSGRYRVSAIVSTDLSVTVASELVP